MRDSRARLAMSGMVLGGALTLGLAAYGGALGCGDAPLDLGTNDCVGGAYAGRYVCTNTVSGESQGNVLLTLSPDAAAGARVLVAGDDSQLSPVQGDGGIYFSAALGGFVDCDQRAFHGTLHDFRVTLGSGGASGSIQGSGPVAAAYDPFPSPHFAGGTIDPPPNLNAATEDAGLGTTHCTWTAQRSGAAP